MLQFSDLRFMFNRSVQHCLERSKWLLTALVLFGTGLFIVVSNALALHAPAWISLSLVFLPIFISSGIWIALGIILIRIYHNEIKNRSFTYAQVLANSLELLLGSAYATVPVLLLFILLWVVLGFFMLLQSVPVVGSLFSVLFAFAPFLLSLAALLMCVGLVFILFFVTPVLALRGLNRAVIMEVLRTRGSHDPFSNLACLLTAAIPFAFFLLFLLFAACLTKNICGAEHDPLKAAFQGLFVMIPFSFLLAPAAIFFFNFAAESHALFIRKKAG